MATVDATDKLPVEMLSKVLDAIENRADMLHASTLSRRWRCIALQSERYYLVFRRHFFQEDRTALNRLAVITSHAVQHGLRLKITIYTNNRSWDDTTAVPRHWDAISAALSGSLSNIIELNLHCVPDDLKRLVAILKTPAPRLRTLKLSAGGEHDRTFSAGHGCVIPVDIFAGNAPVLRRVGLVEIGIGTQAIPAFRNVSCQTLRFESPDAALSVVSQRTMPMLRELDISTYHERDSFDTRLVTVTDTILTKLVLYDGANANILDWVSDDVFRAARKISFHQGCETMNIEAFFKHWGNSGNIFLDLFFDEDYNLKWELRNELTERTIDLLWDYMESGTIERIFATNTIGNRVSCIKSDIQFLPTVLACGQSLDRLGELEIELLEEWERWPIGYQNDPDGLHWDDNPDQPHWTMRCPQLRIVVVSAPRRANAWIRLRMLELLSIALLGDGELPSRTSLRLSEVAIVGGSPEQIGWFAEVSYD